MSAKEQIVREFLNYYNQRSVEGCATFFTEDIELRSTYVKELFPQSDGVLTGKPAVLAYLALLFKHMPNLETGEVNITNTGTELIVKGNNVSDTLNYYLHFSVNDQNFIYLVKSNLTTIL